MGLSHAFKSLIDNEFTLDGLNKSEQKTAYNTSRKVQVRSYKVFYLIFDTILSF